MVETWRIIRYTIYARKGWDENKLDMFRRHIIQLGTTGVL